MKLEAAKDSPWYQVQRCQPTREVISIDGILFDKERGTCWVINNKRGFKLWQLHQFIDAEDTSEIDLNKPYMLGAESFKENLRQDYIDRISRCMEGNTVRVHYSFEYPFKHGFILRMNNDPKQRIYYRDCDDQAKNKSVLAANHIPQYRVCGEETFKLVDDEFSPDVNKTYALIMPNGKVTYFFYDKKVYNIRHSKGVTQLYQIPVVEDCKDELPYSPKVICWADKEGPNNSAKMARSSIFSPYTNECYFRLIYIIFIYSMAL